MTKLLVTPIDPQARGSFKERSRLFAIIADLNDAQGAPSGVAVAVAFKRIEDWLLPRLRTDDGTPVEEVLDQLSAAEFDELLTAVHGVTTVPPASERS